MPNLKDVLSETFLIEATASDPIDRNGMAFPYYSPVPQPKSTSNAQETAIWYWTHETINKTSNLFCKVRTMDHMSMKVCESIEWEFVSITYRGATVKLPIADKYILRRYYLDKGEVYKDAARLWPLEANTDVSWMVVLGYQFEKGNRCEPIPKEVTEHPKFMPNPGVDASSEQVGKDAQKDEKRVVFLSKNRVIVCLSLMCCKERNDFDPGKALDAARIYPHIMVMSNFAMDEARGDKIEASILVMRPEKSTMMPHADEGSMNEEISPILVSDRNQDSSAKKYYKIPDRPYWDNLFSYYDMNPKPGTKYIVVDPEKKIRIISNVADYMNGYTPNIIKLEGQGEYDNLHLAPSMKMPSVLAAKRLSDPAQYSALGFERIAMAPFCAHDCLHTHWRWSDMAARDEERHTLGWGSDAPYSIAGGPMVPRNQKVEIELLKSGVRIMVSIARDLKRYAGKWHVINGQGFAYSIDYHAEINLARLDAGWSWWFFYWHLRYEFRFDKTSEWPSGVPKIAGHRERVRITNLSAARG